MTIQELAAASDKHPYYCSTSNYYSNEPYTEWDTWAEFFDEYKDADVDHNLIFRFDVQKWEDQPWHRINIFIMHQRKGIFAPHYIKLVNDNDAESVCQLLEKHFETLRQIWQPFSSVKSAT